jgi:NMD protein affecting ribosome stability and mRNA decay
MASFEVRLSDERTEVVEGADAYQQEGPLTTFFALRGERQVIDSWSVRLASFRTGDIVAVRRSSPVVPLLRSA